MNAPFLTRGGEGQDRRGFAVADVMRMIEMGIVGEDEAIELIDGEILPLAPETSRHVLIKNRLARVLGRTLPLDLFVATDSTLYLSERTFVEPDIYVVADHADVVNTPASQVLLLIEIARSSSDRDHTAKAALYARHGVQDYWVIDAVTLTTSVFRDPVDGAYGNVQEIPADQPVTALLINGLTVTMQSLETGQA
ncbi:MAG: Uma2 family endonuclease [Hyphomonadaceae bacterium]|nr:Uma2 family endonuclease [Hyphomonadaceae bacterium]